MPNNFEKNSATRKSDELKSSSDSLKENQDSLSIEQLKYREEQQKERSKSREKIDIQEHLKADIDLESDINNLGSNYITISNLKDFIEENFAGNSEALNYAKKHLERQAMFGAKVSKNKLVEKINQNIDKEDNISTADKIKNFKEQLLKEGKSPTVILQTLIAKFENEEAVSVWVDNWKNYLKLHQFAENKPPAEREAIQKIISKANFSDENSFDVSLIAIAQSTEISSKTKLELAREFGGSHIDSVDGMDYQLKQVEIHKKAVENQISVKSREKSSLDSEIESLEDELDTLPLDDPKRQELEEKIEQKKEILGQTENEIDRLEKGKPKDISFQLREGFLAKLNPDGSRSIKIDSAGFAIKIPSNRLPFTSTKNLRAINLAFPYLALKNQNIANTIFVPNLDNNSVPTKSQRDMGHLILSSLGIDDTRILSEENIKHLKKDLSVLTPKNGKTGQENLIELGVFDVDSQSLDKGKLKKTLELTRENRGVRKGFLREVR